MICWNCKADLPSDAMACARCEALLQELPNEKEQALAREIYSQVDEKVKDVLNTAFEVSATAEEFVNRLLVGRCPKCGSIETSDCDNDPSIRNICVGRCYHCGHLWCLECAEWLEHGNTLCDCMDELEEES